MIISLHHLRMTPGEVRDFFRWASLFQASHLAVTSQSLVCVRACTRVNIRENACVYMHVSKFTSAFVCVRTSECVFVCAVSAFECKHALEWIRVGAFTVSALSCVHTRVNTCACVLCLFLFVCVPRANTFRVRGYFCPCSCACHEWIRSCACTFVSLSVYPCV